jgi:hypothetical protein
VFWSKIWFFVVAVLAAAALTIALVMPRPAQRAVAKEETRRLTVACGVVGILLEDDARKRVDLAGSFARQQTIETELAAATAAATLDDARMKKVREVADAKIKDIKGSRTPDFVILIDKKGRVVARVKVEEAEYGDVLAGRPLVDDALHGYLRDDVWLIGSTTYFVSASPVVNNNEYVGAIVLGHKITNEFAARLLGKSLLVELGFYRGTDTLAATQSTPLDQKPMVEELALLKAPDLRSDCSNDINKPIEVRASGDVYTTMVARLPGEAGAHGAYYAVFAKNTPPIGFGATLDVVNQEDLGFSNFPWIVVAGGFIVVLAGGILLMMWEADRPLKRLAGDAVRLAKGETERLAEDAHPGKFGSIARSVNIHIDKLGRDAKSAKKDLDQLLGPAPEGSLGTIDLLATALPSVRPGGAAPVVPPPPSEFRFGDSGAMQARPGPAPARAPTPVPVAPQQQPQPRPGSFNTPPPSLRGAGGSFDHPAAPTSFAGSSFATPPPGQAFGGFATPPPPPPLPVPQPTSLASQLGSQSIPPMTLEEDILGAPPSQSAPASAYFKQIFDQFIAVKKTCNEPTSGLTFEKFSDKLIKNRDDLMAKTGCREVRFTVYVKEGKAALKATPVKDE